MPTVPLTFVYRTPGSTVPDALIDRSQNARDVKVAQAAHAVAIDLRHVLSRPADTQRVRHTRCGRLHDASARRDRSVAHALDEAAAGAIVRDRQAEIAAHATREAPHALRSLTPRS